MSRDDETSAVAAPNQTPAAGASQPATRSPATANQAAALLCMVSAEAMVLGGALAQAGYPRRRWAQPDAVLRELARDLPEPTFAALLARLNHLSNVAGQGWLASDGTAPTSFPTDLAAITNAIRPLRSLSLRQRLSPPVQQSARRLERALADPTVGHHLDLLAQALRQLTDFAPAPAPRSTAAPMAEPVAEPVAELIQARVDLSPVDAAMPAPPPSADPPPLVARLAPVARGVPVIDPGAADSLAIRPGLEAAEPAGGQGEAAEPAAAVPMADAPRVSEPVAEEPLPLPASAAPPAPAEHDDDLENAATGERPEPVLTVPLADAVRETVASPSQADAPALIEELPPSRISAVPVFESVPQVDNPAQPAAESAYEPEPDAVEPAAHQMAPEPRARALARSVPAPEPLVVAAEPVATAEVVPTGHVPDVPLAVSPLVEVGQGQTMAAPPALDPLPLPVLPSLPPTSQRLWPRAPRASYADFAHRPAFAPGMLDAPTLPDGAGVPAPPDERDARVAGTPYPPRTGAGSNSMTQATYAQVNLHNLHTNTRPFAPTRDPRPIQRGPLAPPARQLQSPPTWPMLGANRPRRRWPGALLALVVLVLVACAAGALLWALSLTSAGGAAGSVHTGAAGSTAHVAATHSAPSHVPTVAHPTATPNAGPPVLAVAPTALRIPCPSSGNSAMLTISDRGGATVHWRIANPPPLLAFSAYSGSVSPGASSAIQVRALWTTKSTHVFAFTSDGGTASISYTVGCH